MVVVEHRELTSDRVGSVDRLRVSDRMAFVANTLMAFKSQPGSIVQWQAASREVIKAVPSLVHLTRLWKELDQIKMRQHQSHAAAARPGSSMVREPLFRLERECS